MRRKPHFRITILLWSIGGSALALQGCDQTVRSTMLDGVQSAATTLATTLIQAFFQGLGNDQQQPVNTVMISHVAADFG